MVFPGFASRYRFPSPFVPAPWPVVLPQSFSARFSGPSPLLVRLMIEGLKEVQLKNMLKKIVQWQIFHFETAFFREICFTDSF